MIETSKLKLKMVNGFNFDTTDIKDTIIEYGSNFQKIEDYVTHVNEITDLTNLTIGEVYKVRERYENMNPQVNSYFGWINIREGVYAPKREKNHFYEVDDLIVPVNDNGNVYKCISKGRSTMSTPVYQLLSGAEFWDYPTQDPWQPEYNYDVGTIIFPTNLSHNFYFYCETAGLSSDQEPHWDSIQESTTVIDGTVVWRKERLIKWKQVDKACMFRPYGKID